ncbi:hypothetical protein G7072_14080 [Nocardioides sp. HDW12B]|uniref:hypothetical protein n=1 Tax=Nocardioides sp. HDW12B TaxID=2714939 RepID=UPI00140CCF39|nr:hypothetical protein [Nocardioides sp. HDW12B]QIK67327.1 hypothetical protein G7072_14080 [Nocardioides sp. HDW12B]
MTTPNHPLRVPVQQGPVYADLDLADLGAAEGRVSALVVHESSFGNTRTIAMAVAEGVAAALEGDASVALAAANRVEPEMTQSVRMLLVGAPTHAFALPRQSTREDAVRQGATGPVMSGVREWIGTLPVRSRDAMAATFDTRVELMRHLPGSAATSALKQLGRHGYRTVEHESFYVTGTPGPLLPGEEERAYAWGRRVATEMRAALAARTGR